ncbi:protease 4-like [Schistocerca gregaria]|uniref:protease 4-like n=1 Tax=Schistocerca gregaria TaxID=7010 RepID=UPI00211E8444|nr:protease 4-like [Schistocerca gregaria]
MLQKTSDRIKSCDKHLSKFIRDSYGQFYLYSGFAASVIGALSLLRYKYFRKRVCSYTVLELDLTGCTLSEQQPDINPLFSLFVDEKILHVHTLIYALKVASTDHRVLGLVVKLGQITANLTQLQELRSAVVNFRATGKKTLCYAHTFKEFADASAYYWFASAFEEIYVSPSGYVNVVGIKANSFFLKGLFEKVNLEFTLVARRKYKTAPNMLTESQFTEEHKETVEYILNSVYDQFITDIAASRNMEVDNVKSLIYNGPYNAATALDLKLIDGLKYENQFYNEVLNSKFGSIEMTVFTRLCRRLTNRGPYELLYIDRYFERAIGKYYRGAKTKIGYIDLVGTIYMGENKKTWNGLDISAGSETLLLAFREAIACSSIKAIIFRIDSGGGSAQASDIISDALRLAKQSGKKVIVSMGQAAASGGYYVAAHADKIVANPLTFTGSIGVFAGKLSMLKFWNQFGITFDSVQTSPSGEYFDPLSGYSEENRAKLESFVDDVYDQFKGHVCQGRSLTPDRVEELAQGRIWTGKTALEKGLVDALGGLETAIDVAKKELGLSTQTAISLVPFPAPTSMLEKIFPKPQKNSRDIRKRSAFSSFYTLFPSYLQALFSVFSWTSKSATHMFRTIKSLEKLAPLVHLNHDSSELYLPPCTIDLQTDSIVSNLTA